jgi:calcium-dependent protein kinase
VFYDANKLPRTDLGLEGTPWFLAPENLSSEFYPASDIWSAGVMAYQLLSGYLPFDDRRNRNNPALSQVMTALGLGHMSRWLASGGSFKLIQTII